MSEKKRTTGHFIVKNDKGLHTRPCTELVKCASTFNSDILLRYQKNTVNAKSVLSLLMLAANKGAKIYVEAEGDDAEEALKSILDLAQEKFYIKY